jgi:predicted ester cyclase
MSTTTTAEENKRIARQFPEDVATGGDIDRIEELCTPDVVDRSPLGEVHGQEELKHHLKSIRAAFSGHSATVEDAVAEGDTVAMRVTLRGTHDGEFMGIEPTGNDFAVTNMVFTRIEDGRIAERWVNPDMYGLMQQLDAVDAPGE